MIELPYPVYVWVKVVHLLAVTTWEGGMVILPLLFAADAEQPAEGGAGALLRAWERRVLWRVAWPAGIVAVGSGLLLLANYGDFDERWLWLKAGLAWFLVVWQVRLTVWVVGSPAGFVPESAGFFQRLALFPVAVFVALAVLVEVRPFS